ncbi:MAG: hypothetical protein ACE5HS_10625 [bacterium]
MDLISLTKKDKELFSQQLERPDITYQVWELGRLFACISEVVWRMRAFLNKEHQGQEGSNLDREAKNLFENFLYLCKILSNSMRVLGDITKIAKDIARFTKEDQGSALNTKIDLISQEIKEWQNRILYEIRAKSIHLYNIYICSVGLRSLQTKLMYGVHETDVEQHIQTNIENLEKLEKGDKLLTSPNCEITPHILRIIKYRLNGVISHLSELRKFAEENPVRFKELIEERAEILEYLILDIKNPADYLSPKRRLLINIVPFIVCYYLVVIPIVIFSELNLWSFLMGNKLFIALLSGLIPPFMSFLIWVFQWTKNQLIISSFKYQISEFILD